MTPTVQQYPIGSARRLPVGESATIVGTVTTPAGVFNSSYADLGFAIQDSSGGVFVSMHTASSYAPNDRVQVTGTLQRNPTNGLVVIVPQPKQVTWLGAGRPVTPLKLPTGKIDATTQGLLLTTSGTIISGPTNDSTYGHKMAVDDGSGPVNVYINTGTRIDPSRFRTGERVDVTGFGGVYDGTPEIDVRGPQDLTGR